MSSGDRRDDGEAEPRPRLAAPRGPAAESFEDRRLRHQRDADPVVAHSQQQSFAHDLGAELHRGRVSRVGDRVGRELEESPGEALGIHLREDAWGRRGRPPQVVRQRLGLRAHALQQGRHIGRFDREPQRAVRLRQVGDVAHEPVHAVEFAEGERAGRGDVIRSGRVEQFEVPAHDRDGRLEFVTDVAEQLTLAGERAVETIEHAVDGHRKVRHVVAARHGDALAHVGRRDAGRGLPQSPDRSEQTAGDRPADEGDHDERHGRHDRERTERVSERTE